MDYIVDKLLHTYTRRETALNDIVKMDREQPLNDVQLLARDSLVNLVIQYNRLIRVYINELRDLEDGKDGK